MKKKILSALITISMLFTPYAAALADEPTSAESTSSSEMAAPRYGESVKTVLLATNYRSVITEPQQPANGFKLPTGGCIYVNAAAGPKYTFNVSVNWGVVSTGLSIGTANSSSASGICLTVPTTKHYYKAKVQKDLKISHTRLDYYEYAVLKYSSYRDVVEVIGLVPYLVRT
ncbi:hypothetical protein [Bifidobacterium aerophilum]|uniref:Uncharacterized protein n=1 Tax=Bifidobacterium aerophilum TaxID=1798155 RepID=A0A6N9Z2G3_9BIFI|nr:hypothetical protein [Bifidobacterium aerophilum]NEG88732.1 hypothetical protein [Bifidobacterium aerophilum]